MSFAVDIRLAARDVALGLEVAAGETVAVVGPNGAGKSTLLDAIAGVIRPDSGRCELDGTVLFDLPAGGPHARWTPPHRRGVSLLAQEALLFPHLTVLENVAFGPRSSGASRVRSREVAHAWLREVDADDLAGRHPAELSGGQAQRIAVARALATDPALLLLDEPLAALDVSVAPAVRRMLRRVLAERSALIITHDVLDAFTLADRVVVVEGGRIVDEGSPAEVFDRPRTPFAAELSGVNLLTGRREGDRFVIEHPAGPDGTGEAARSPSPADAPPPRAPRADDFSAVSAPTLPDSAVAPTLPVSAIALDDWPDGSAGIPMSLAVRPSTVSVSAERPTPGMPCLRARMIDLEPRGDLVRVRSALLSADVSPREAAALDAAVGSDLWFSFPREAALVYPTMR